MIINILWIILAYLLGSIPFGLVFSKILCNIDPRASGSGNIGATNIARLCGKKLGILTLIFDILKGIIAIVVATKISDSYLMYSFSGLAVMCGHLFSCFMHFKGGKAVATYIGVFIPLAFWQLFVPTIICIFFIWRSGFVSLGTLLLVSTFPVLLLLTGQFKLLPLSLIALVLIVYKHQGNIQRLISGTENTWFKSSK